MQPCNNQSSTLNTSSGGARSHRVPLQRDRLRAAVLVAFVVSAVQAATALPQDVVKPTVDPIVRLPAPTPIAARQRPDGRIEVTWTAVVGAERYELWRSVPPAGQVIVPLPDPTATIYVDADVKAGSTYYYVVAGINGAGIGLKASSAPVTVTATATTTIPTSSTAPSQTVQAKLVGPTSVSVSFTPVTGATSYRVDRMTYLASTTDPTQMAPTPVATAEAYAGLSQSFTDNIGSSVSQRWMRYQVTPFLGLGTGSTVGSQYPYVVVPATTTSTAGTTSSTTASSGSTTFTEAASTAIKIGTTASLASIAGTSGARWVSVNESVATVDASGIVTGRASGSTHVLGMSGAPDGSLRIVAVPVTVTP